MPEAKMTREVLIELLQCPGCIHGSDTKCGVCHIDTASDDKSFHCRTHYPGTMVGALSNKVYLGMPTGFNKVGDTREGVNNNIWIYLDTIPEYNEKFTIPFWYRQYGRLLFIRVYCPRINHALIWVVYNKKPEDIPGLIERAVEAPPENEMD